MPILSYIAIIKDKFIRLEDNIKLILIIFLFQYIVQSLRELIAKT